MRKNHWLVRLVINGEVKFRYIDVSAKGGLEPVPQFIVRTLSPICSEIVVVEKGACSKNPKIYELIYKQS